MDRKLDISFDRFIRTTEPAHHKASQAIWQAMAARGDIYLGRYEGWYSVRDEAYYGEEELVTADSGEKLSPQGTLVEWTVEESWFFRLSAYQDKLLAHYAANPDFIRPESRRNEVLRFVEGGLTDLSISRASFDWGVKVPGDERHVMYVWLDALTNYITGVGYPDGGEPWDKYWPADLHIIGKDVVRFHAVYWPAFLMSAGLAAAEAGLRPRLPALARREDVQIGRQRRRSGRARRRASAWIRCATICCARSPSARTAATAPRRSSPRSMPICRTASATSRNELCLLSQRIVTDYYRRTAKRMRPMRSCWTWSRRRSGRMCPRHFEALALSQGIEAWLRGVFACNQYIDAQAPWTLRKTDPERMQAVLATLVARSSISPSRSSRSFPAPPSSSSICSIFRPTNATMPR